MKKLIYILILKIVIVQITFASIKTAPSVKDVVANLLTRMTDEFTPQDVDNLTRAKVLEI